MKKSNLQTLLMLRYMGQKLQRYEVTGGHLSDRGR
ncbi:hypothetical protein X961_3750 [Burkholderia pseudomallei MSHR5613]|nr:hypothetical protein DO65_5826 [Burkholderia pseudomallei]KGS37021.1 hypothetical protein X945_5409 [Burkholderia pseudomallei ABCPW 107]KGS38193.1 hypothetical protein X992_5527 [Burkholderia pseudomallei MSHR5492]KGS48624.1 hypothetical protein X961_3750 [Burkholderia pseudomallei MSHR5613]KGS57023.1 hypothetical protein X949_3967 [Burkholderia pseudomallei MSHR5609]KGS70049.1 hypothetical protein X979_5333 [Burkholderia pseudomallei MSHR7527]KGW96159.1 hypothetical protein Y034_4650 [Bu